MVTSTGDFEFEVAEWGVQAARPWHFPLPKVHWRPKIKSMQNISLVTRYTHKGAHRRDDATANARVWQNTTCRLLVMAVALYHYYVVTMILKGADSAHNLLWAGNTMLAFAMFSAGIWTLNHFSAITHHTVTAADIVYLNGGTANGVSSSESKTTE